MRKRASKFKIMNEELRMNCFIVTLFDCSKLFRFLKICDNPNMEKKPNSTIRSSCDPTGEKVGLLRKIKFCGREMFLKG